jgi:hypothetical protein
MWPNAIVRGVVPADSGRSANPGGSLRTAYGVYDIVPSALSLRVKLDVERGRANYTTRILPAECNMALSRRAAGGGVVIGDSNYRIAHTQSTLYCLGRVILTQT